MTAPAIRGSGARGESWLHANRAYLDHALAALRHALAGYGRALRRARELEPLVDHRHEVVSDEEFDRLVVAGPAGRRGSPESDRLRRAEEEVAAAKAAAMEAVEAPPALIELGRRFGLAPCERWILLAVAAPELEPDFARLYAYAGDDIGLTGPTPDLLDRLWSGERPTPRPVVDALLPGGRLHRWDLVRHAAPRGRLREPTARTPLVTDARVAAYLAGTRCADERVGHLLRRVAVVPAVADHAEISARLASWLAGTEGRAPVVQLLGRPGSGRRALSALAAARLGLALHAVDLDGLPSGEDARDALRRLAREAALLPTALYLDAGEASRSPEGRPALARLGAAVEALAVPLFVGSRDPLGLDRAGLVVSVPRLEAAARAELLRRALGPVEPDPGLDRALEAAAEQFDLGPEASVRAVAMARDEARLAAGRPAAVGPAELWRACKRLAGADLEDLAQRIDPVAGWEDIVLPADVLARLRELADQVAHRPTVYGAWGFGARLVRGRGIAALFTGGSGTGKTLAAEVLAGHLDLEMYRIDLAGLISKYIGETERNLRRVFEAAESGGGILFFDEADALFGRRTEVRDSHDRYANVEIDYLLQRMEEYRGLAILATNRKTALDRAFLRRLRFLVEFPFPDAAARRGIWRRVFPPETPLAAIDVDALARLELAGGSIRNVAVNAAFRAAAADEPLGMGHLAAAARAEYAKCEKAMTQAELAVLAAAEEAA